MSTSDDREPWRAYVTTDYGKRCPGCRRPGVSRFLAYERPPTWPDDDEIKITRFCRWCWHETGRDRVYRAAGGRPVEIKLDFYSNSGFPWLTRRHLERGELLPTHFKDPTDPLQWLVFADYYEEKDDKWATLLCKLVGHQVPKFYVDSLGKVTGKNIRFGFRWSWRESGPTGPRTVWQPEDAALLSCQPGMTHRRPPTGSFALSGAPTSSTPSATAWAGGTGRNPASRGTRPGSTGSTTRSWPTRSTRRDGPNEHSGQEDLAPLAGVGPAAPPPPAVPPVPPVRRHLLLGVRARQPRDDAADHHPLLGESP